jgi:phosphoribosylanthranilate isomerase
MDVSSGIEIKPGVKDKELMDSFFSAIKSCS